MTDRVIDISTPSTRLRVRNEQLVVAREEQSERTVPIEDIGILIINHPSITLSQSVATRLAAAKAAIVFCGTNQMPVSLSLPLSGHNIHSVRLKQQIEASRPLKKRLWQSIVRCKIKRQGDVLLSCNKEALGLHSMARRVRSGDPDNLEAQAAQRYWPALMGKSFRRDRDGFFPNPLLNYGYAIIRSVVARSLCMAGLHPALGIFHHNRSNAFALADDVMEVWRPYIDLRVRQILDEKYELEINAKGKQALLSTLNESVLFKEGCLPMQLAIQRMASSLARSFEEGNDALMLPEKFK